MKSLIFISIAALVLIGCTTSKKVLQEANVHFESLEYDLAINKYKEVFDYKPTEEIAYKLATSHFKKREFKEAEFWYIWYQQGGEMAISKLYELAEIYIGNSKFEDAKSVLKDIAAADETETVSPKWQMLNKSVFEAKDLLNAKTPFVLNPLKSVNTAFSEFGFTQFGNDHYFISDRINIASNAKERSTSSQRYGWTGNGFLKVFQGVFDSLAMDFKSLELSKEFSGELHYGPISLDSLFSFNTFTPQNAKTKVGKWREITPKINFTDNRTGERRLIPSIPEDFLTDPFWEASSQRLYFASNFSGSYGDLDLYYMQYGQGTWGNPVNLGKGVNSFGIERSPFVFQDTLYFSSNGLGGLGGLDIYKIHLQKLEVEQPINMGVPFNSNKDDFFFFIDESLGNAQFLSSDRDGGMGMDDIFQVISIPQDLIRNVVVKVVEEESGTPLTNIAIEFQRQGTNLSQNLITNERGLADFNLNKIDSVITIKVYGSGFLNFQLDNFKVAKNDTILVRLQKLILNTPIVFDNILYDFDDYSIRRSENEALVNLVTNLLNNPGLNIELRSHTDTRGSEAYNLKLSRKRSESVQAFLINSGVDRSRIFIKSYGELYPIFDCGDNCSTAEHQLNRRTEIVFFYGGFKNSPYAFPLVKAGGLSNSSDTAQVEQVLPPNENVPEKKVQETSINLSSTSNQGSAFYYLVVDSFESMESAQYLKEKLATLLGRDSYIITPMDSKNRYRVAVERFETAKGASVKKEFYKNKLKRRDIWILFLDSEDAILK